MSSFSKEISKLVENLNNYSAEKYNYYIDEAKSIYTQQKKYINALTDITSSELISAIDHVERTLEESKGAAKEKQHEIYNKVVKQLHVLNKLIESKSNKK